MLLLLFKPWKDPHLHDILHGSDNTKHLSWSAAYEDFRASLESQRPVSGQRPLPFSSAYWADRALP